MSVLLIHPPVAKPCEPPPGLARLAGSLAAVDIPCRVWDANLACLLHLIGATPPAPDTWTRRALKNRDAHLADLRDPRLYFSFDRYVRAVSDINRLLAAAGSARAVELSLADYQERHFWPVRSHHLAAAAEEPEKNVFYPIYSTHLRHLLTEREPAVIGLSVNFLSQALTAWSMAGFLRQEAPHIRIALGGGLITSWLRRPSGLRHAAGIADYLIQGPGEAELVRLAGGPALPETPPLPDYTGLPLDSYLSAGRIIPFSTASGCYWARCAFCPEQAEGNPYQPLPTSEAAAQLRRLVQRHKPRLLHLVDNALSPAFLKKIIHEPPGASWYGFARVTPELQDKNFCRALRESGCVMLQLGLESGDDMVLAALDKGMTVADAGRTLAALKQAGIGTYVYLLFGMPEENTASALRTLEFTVAHSADIDFLNLAVFNMPVNASDAAKLPKRSFYDGDLDLYTGFEHSAGWSRAAVRRFLDRKFKRHPAIAPIVRRDPPIFTSNHAPFFLQ